MTSMAPDIARQDASRLVSGLTFALISAAAFGLSGALARGLIESGWTAAAAVTARVTVAAVVLAPAVVMTMRGRWGLVRRNHRLIVAYGLVAVAGTQLAYFNAVMHMEVGVALLIEYTAPVVVVVWLWLRYGQRPSGLTLLGTVLALLGLVLVLDLTGGATISSVGLAWAFASTLGAATYFVLSADEGNGLPPVVLAGLGMVVGAVALVLAGLLGVVPFAATTAPAQYGATTVAWWLPLLGLGVVTAALAYTTGIAASRRLGSRLASFVALSEVLMAILFAWLLLGELPVAAQIAGGVLILLGVVGVKSGERRVTQSSSLPKPDMTSRSALS